MIFVIWFIAGCFTLGKLLLLRYPIIINEKVIMSVCYSLRLNGWTDLDKIQQIGRLTWSNSTYDT